MSEPLKVSVVRWKCPTCGRNHSSKARAVTHMATCWYNPAARGCKTCVHFTPYYRDEPDDCAEGVDLRGTAAINAERDFELIDRFVAPGPITSCAKWQARTDSHEE